MCRHIAYTGTPVTLHDLLYAAPHALLEQSYAPRMNKGNRLNADGFGAGWYVAGRAEPVRFRRAQPMWSDVSFADIAPVIGTGCLLAAVRSATVGFPVDESCAQPFRAGPWLFSHNGRVDGYARVEVKLRGLAGDAPPPDARAPVDSAPLFALAVRRWTAGESLAEGLAGAVIEASRLTTGRFNLLATDGHRMAATVCGDTLFARRLPGGTVLASEPYDDAPEWTELPEGSLVTADPEGHRVTPL
ncbi:MAG: ergothioneine biosynthesis protein EgtC [Streptosporangiales bacterium]|nr:ergothioneine biosynthesis protein EgtC [Streptosporangiales bacterium]